jgi:hypothetical protein
MSTALLREYTAVEAVIAAHRNERLAKSYGGKKQTRNEAILASAQGIRDGVIARAVLAGDGSVLRKVDRRELDGLREPQRQMVGEAVALDLIRQARGA